MSTTSKRESSKKRSTRSIEKSFCEFFAGIGLVGRGLHSSGWDCVYANDVDSTKQKLFESLNGPSPHFHLEDVWNTESVIDRIPGRPLLATASFPCTDLSTAGHYRGLEGKQSSTFFAFIRALENLGDRKPPLVLLENVPGFLTSHRGADFTTAMTALSDVGYRLDAFVLDAQYFVPQSRQRVFVVGVQRDIAVTLPQRGRAFAEDELHPANLVRLVWQLPSSVEWLGLALPRPPKRSLTLRDVIGLGADEAWWSEDEVRRHYEMMHDYHRERVDELLAKRTTWVGTIYRRIRANQQRAEVRFDGLAGCLRTPSGGSARQIVVATKSGKLLMRWMSPREYAALQGVPDFPLVGTTREQLWGFGDAVCVPAVAWVDNNVISPLSSGIRA